MSRSQGVEESNHNNATHDQLEYGTLFEPFQRAEVQGRDGTLPGVVNQDNIYMSEVDDTTPSERRAYDSWRPGGKAKAGLHAPKKVNVEKQELIEKRLSMERPCRSLFIRNIGYSTSDEVIREIYSAYGELQNFHTLLDRRGMAFISYYDLRHAENAKAGTHGQLVDSRAGTLRVRLSTTNEPEPHESEISHFFTPYGDIKSLSHADEDRIWIIEFYDSRACIRAYNEAHGLKIGSVAISTELEWDADDRVPDKEEHLAITSSLRRRSRSPVADRRAKDDKSRGEKSRTRSRSREREKAPEARRDLDTHTSRAGRSRSRSRSRSRDRDRDRERDHARSRSPPRDKNYESRSTKSFPWENNYRPRENREHREDSRRPYVSYRGLRPNRQATYEIEWPQHILDMQPVPLRKRRDSTASREDPPRRPSVQSRDSLPPSSKAPPPPPPPPPPLPVPPAPVATPSVVPGITPQQAAALLQNYNPLLANSIIQQQQQLQMEQKAQQQIMSLLTELTSNRMTTPVVTSLMPAMSSQSPQNFAASIPQAGRSAPVKDPRLNPPTSSSAYSAPEASRTAMSTAAPVNIYSQLAGSSVAPPGVNLGASNTESQVQQLVKLLSQQGQSALGGLALPGMNASITGSTGFGIASYGGVSGAMMAQPVPAQTAAAPSETLPSSGYNPSSAFIDRERSATTQTPHRAPLPSQHDTMLSENLLSDQQRAYLVDRERGTGGNNYRQDAPPPSTSRLDWSPARSASTYDEYGTSSGKRQRTGDESEQGRSNMNNAKYARTENYYRGTAGGAGAGAGTGAGSGGSASGEPYVARDNFGNEQTFTAHGQQQRRGGGGSGGASGYERVDDRGDYDYGDRNDYRRDRGDPRGGYRGRGRYSRP
ncbi:hypothetical protein BGW41_006786 [Actinomortierella wolfii]|nr:hypothetical protein BGW41_006786 [Actinomortierella wolfii]